MCRAVGWSWSCSVPAGLVFDAGLPFDFDDGSALNPNTSTTASTAMTESHTNAGRREDAGLILNPPRPTCTQMRSTGLGACSYRSDGHRLIG